MTRELLNLGSDSVPAQLLGTTAHFGSAVRRGGDAKDDSGAVHEG